jgi:hypothetical protein
MRSNQRWWKRDEESDSFLALFAKCVHATERMLGGAGSARDISFFTSQPGIEGAARVSLAGARQELTA